MPLPPTPSPTPHSRLPRLASAALMWLTARTPRERASLIAVQATVAMVCVAPLLLPRDTAQVDPSGARGAAERQQEGLINRLASLSSVSPDVAVARSERARSLAEQQRQLAQWSDALAARERGLPSHGGDLPTLRSTVSQLLTRHPGLRLVALTADPEGLRTPGPSGDARLTAPSARRHDVEITLDGDYLTLMAYVAALEERLPQARWVSLRATRVAHGVSRLTLALSVHTGQP